MAPPTWNKRTGNLVGGHQRLLILDALERGRDYLVTVAVVDMDEKTERETNLILNNQSAMGEWDEDGLAALLKDETFPIDVQAAGFDRADLEVLLADPAAVNSLWPIADEIAAVAAAGDRAEAIKKKKAKLAAGLASIQLDNDAEFYLVIVCSDAGEAKALGRRLGLLPGEKYLDATRLKSHLAGDA